MASFEAPNPFREGKNQDVEGTEEQHAPLIPITMDSDPPSCPPSRLSILAIQFITASTVACVLFSLGFLVSGLWLQPSDWQCTRKLNAWSPMLEAVEYNTVEPRHFDPLYMGIPTDQMEKAWDALWQFGSMAIPEEQLILLNKSTTERDWHHLPTELGGGIQAYFEGFHYLHCLNLIRQYNHRHERDYSHLPAFLNQDINILEHVEHCLEMLRAKIMCESDTELYPVSIDPAKGNVVRLPAKRRCRDLVQIANWANAHITVPFNAHIEV